jgi:hypothetical protein
VILFVSASPDHDLLEFVLQLIYPSQWEWAGAPEWLDGGES